MKKIEELLNIDLGRKFDTPKKLNRSGKQIPAQIIEDLENGKFTAEMIEDLRKQFPIFHYRTCITIHGAWNDINRTNIGQYKNVHQNKNGSVEIYYSAIDRDKIKQIRNMKEGIKCNFHYLENSTDRVFRWSETVTRETLPQVRAKMEPIGKSLANLPIYGYINLYLTPTLWGGLELVLDVHPLAIRQENVQAVTLSLLGMTEEQYQEADSQRQANRITEAARVEAANKVWEEKQRVIKAEAEESLNKLKPAIEFLPECNDPSRGILVKIMPNKYEAGHHFTFIRKDGPGAFGRIKISKAESPTYTPGMDLQWKEGKQQSKEDLKRFKGWRLITIPEGYTKDGTPWMPKGYLTREQGKAYNTPEMIKKRKENASNIKVISTINY